jgi:N6-adenosine-specific RNA methylase IME4
MFEGRRRYRVIYADPPWKFSAGGTRNPAKHYPTLAISKIKNLPIEDLAHSRGCRLFLWTTIPHLYIALQTMSLWGFRYSSARVWCKLKAGADPTIIRMKDIAIGTGLEIRNDAEILLLGKRGKPPPPAHKSRNMIFASRREHSRKPDCVRDEIAKYYAGPRIELFARSRAPGWDAWGNELDKFTDNPRRC